MKVLIKNVKIADERSPYNNQVKQVLIDGEIISKIGDSSDEKADRIVEGQGNFLSPGWFDLRSVLHDPGYEHKEDLWSGAAAAMEGGFTGVACLPETSPIIQSKEIVHYILNTSKNFLTDIYPLAAVTNNLKGEELTEMIDLHQAGALAFTDGNHPIWHAGVLIRALIYMQPFNGLIIQHAEEKKLTQYGQMNEGITSTYLGLKGMPHIAEELVIKRDIELLKYAGGKIHFSHISSANAVDMIRTAKKEGLKVSCDVAVLNLVFDDTVLATFDTNYKLNPPLRTKADIEALWKGLEDETIDAIVTDHIPQDVESKFLEFDMAEFGATNLETAFSALIAHKPAGFSLEKLITKISAGPRGILGLPVNTIKEGEKANLTYFSDNKEWVYSGDNIKSKSKNSPFFNKKLRGKALAVFNKGQSYFSA